VRSLVRVVQADSFVEVFAISELIWLKELVRKAIRAQVLLEVGVEVGCGGLIDGGTLTDFRFLRELVLPR